MAYLVRINGANMWIVETKGKDKDFKVIRSRVFTWDKPVEDDGVILSLGEIQEAIRLFVRGWHVYLTQKISFSLWSSRIYRKEFRVLEKTQNRTPDEIEKIKDYIHKYQKCSLLDGSGMISVGVPRAVVEGYHKICTNMGFIRARLEVNFNAIETWMRKYYAGNSKENEECVFFFWSVGENILIALFKGGKLILQRNLLLASKKSKTFDEIIRFLFLARVKVCERTDKCIFLGDEDNEVLAFIRNHIEHVKRIEEVPDWNQCSEWIDLIGLAPGREGEINELS